EQRRGRLKGDYKLLRVTQFCVNIRAHHARGAGYSCWGRAWQQYARQKGSSQPGQWRRLGSVLSGGGCRRRIASRARET
ncbi:hypothetical protein JG687_00011355, partial [Phytophthora cactorum]